MPTPRALIAVSNSDFRVRLASLLTQRGIAADAIEGSTAASALLGVTPYTHVVLEADANDANIPRLLSDITFRADPPKLVLLVADEPAEFRRKLKAFSPDLLMTATVDDATAAAIVTVCTDSAVALPSSELTKERLDEGISDQSATLVVEGSAPIAFSKPSTKAVIAVRLADDTRAGALAALLEAEGFAVQQTQTTDQLYTMLNHDRIDLLIIEERLPGFLSGLDVIEMLQRELLRPDVLLLSHVPRSLAERITALMPNRIASPNASMKAVADSARALLQQRKAMASLIPQSARQVVNDHPDLRPLPQLLVKLTNYLSLDEHDILIRDLAHDIESDPRATSDLLRFTNSSSHGLRRRVASVGDAVTLLGPRRAIVLILSQSATASSTALVEEWAEPLKTWFFRRSVLTAGLAQAFARIEGVSPDTAFLMGLVQDIGIAVTANANGHRYARLIERAQSVPQLHLPTVEHTEFGHTHADVSAALLQKWEMPPSLIDPVLAHHGTSVRMSAVGQGFVHVMQIAEAMADLADCRCPQRSNRLNELLGVYTARQRERCQEAMVEGIAKAVEATELLRLPIPSPKTMMRLAAELQAVEQGDLLAIV